MKENCTPISSNCITWTGPNIPCIKLCKGDSITDVVYNFAMSYCDLLSQLDPSKYNLACLNDKKCPPKSFQELVQLLITKICDVEKQEGPQGPAGADGANGQDGDSVQLVAASEEICPCGGTIVQIIDFEGTVLQEYFLCSGCDGNDGAVGPVGATGPQGPKGDQGDPGADGVCEDCLDTGWVDLLGFEFMTNPPQARRIGNMIHFRGSILIPLPDAEQGNAPLQQTALNQNYEESTLVTPSQTGAGSVDLTSAGAVYFNSSQNVIPPAVLNVATTPLDNAYRLSFEIGTRRVLVEQDGVPANLISTLLTALANIIVLPDGKMLLTTMRDAEESSIGAYKDLRSYNTSHTNNIISHVRDGEYVPSYDSPNTTIHSNPLAGAQATQVDFTLRGHSSSPQTPQNFLYRMTVNANDITQIGGFEWSLDGLIAYIAP